MNKNGEVNELYKSDLLIIGGGVSGLVTAIKAKEDNKNLDILVVDKGVIGLSGMATKAGNGIVASAKNQPIEKFAEYLVKYNGEYLNDQEFLQDYLSTNLKSVEYLVKCGVQVSQNEDGSIALTRFPNNLWSDAGIQLNVVQSLKKYALKVGIRLLNRVQVFELLTNGKRVIGGIGFDMDNMECHVFHAKAVAVATAGCHFKKIGGMFMGYGNGIAAAYRVGAQMRNAEFCSQSDVVYKANNHPVYGAFNLVHNKNGENISNKYAPGSAEVTNELVFGMEKEIKEGRGPLYCDLRIPDEVREVIGGTVNCESVPRMFPDKEEWEEHVRAKAAKYGKPLTDTPEVTIHMVIQAEPITVDRKMRTTVQGLWAPGPISYQGQAYFGWVRGDGLGNAAQCGIRAGESMAEYASTTDFLDLNPNQIKKLKEKIYAPLYNETTHEPKEIFNRIEELSFSIDKMIRKTESSIKGVLAEVDDMKKIVPELTADDPHSLAKCHEAADSLLCLEMIYRASLMRTESRGYNFRHYRADYPNRDDKNWLKWICIEKGEMDEMKLYTEDIPMDRYPVKPEGYVSKN